MAAKRKGHVSGWCSDQSRWAIYIRDNYTCQYCGTQYSLETASGQLDLDHLQTRAAAKAAGLRINNTPGNLVTACKACNNSRNDKPLEDFAPAGARLRILTQILKPIDPVAGMAAYNASRVVRGFAPKAR